MTDSSTQGIKIVLHPVSDLATAKAVYTALLGIPPSTYRRQATRAMAGMPPCVAKQVTRPVRNREAPVIEPQLA